MKIFTSSLFCEPGCRFSISHKVSTLIWQKLNELIIPNEFQKGNSKTDINLIVTTSSNTKKLEVKGPDYDRRNKMISWGLWLPYKDIVSAKDQLKPYIHYFFEATVLILKNYGINEDDIQKAQSIIESEVIDNPEYIYEEGETVEVDLSDLGL